jgi:hypothetical protein
MRWWCCFVRAPASGRVRLRLGKFGRSLGLRCCALHLSCAAFSTLRLFCRIPGALLLHYRSLRVRLHLIILILGLSSSLSLGTCLLGRWLGRRAWRSLHRGSRRGNRRCVCVINRGGGKGLFFCPLCSGILFYPTLII